MRDPGVCLKPKIETCSHDFARSKPRCVLKKKKKEEEEEEERGESCREEQLSERGRSHHVMKLSRKTVKIKPKPRIRWRGRGRGRWLAARRPRYRRTRPWRSHPRSPLEETWIESGRTQGCNPPGDGETGRRGDGEMGRRDRIRQNTGLQPPGRRMGSKLREKWPQIQMQAQVQMPWSRSA